MHDEELLSLLSFAGQDWRDRARCRDIGIDIFYPVLEDGEPDTTFVVKDAPGNPGEYCTKCLVNRECLKYAIENKMYDGVYGGTNEADRRRLINIRVREKRAIGKQKRLERNQLKQ